MTTFELTVTVALCITTALSAGTFTLVWFMHSLMYDILFELKVKNAGKGEDSQCTTRKQ